MPNHVLFHVFDVFLLGLVAAHLLRGGLGSSLHEGVVVAAVVVQLFGVVVQVHDVAAHVVQKVLRVTHHEQELFPLGQVVFEPDLMKSVQRTCEKGMPIPSYVLQLNRTHFKKNATRIVFVCSRYNTYHGLHVEVVRGLVQQEQVGLDEERSRERHPHAPPPAEGLGLHVHPLDAEAQASQNVRGARFRGSSVQLLEPRVP
jgi:hypothetical protein